MKKTASSLLSLIMVVLIAAALYLPAFAADSPTTASQVTLVGATMVVDGKEVDVLGKIRLIPNTSVSAEKNMTAAEKKTYEKAVASLQTEEETKGTMTVVSIFYISIDDSLLSAVKKNGITLRIKVNGMKEDQDYRYMHCGVTADPSNTATWETGLCKKIIASSICEFTLHDFSPIAIVTSKAAVSTTAAGTTAVAASTTTTGSNNMMLWIIIAAVAVILIIIICVASSKSKKKKATTK